MNGIADWPCIVEFIKFENHISSGVFSTPESVTSVDPPGGKGEKCVCPCKGSRANSALCIGSGNVFGSLGGVAVAAVRA